MIYTYARPRVLKLLSCSIQLSRKCQQLIKLKLDDVLIMPKYVTNEHNKYRALLSCV